MITSLWTWILLYALFVGANNGLHFEKAVLFLMLIGAYALARRYDLTRGLHYLAWILAALVLADFFNLLPVPDATVAEYYFGGLAHRPNLLQPNLLACYMLLLPWGWWTPAVILLCTSRGALIGYMGAQGIQHWQWIKYIAPLVVVVILIAFSFRFSSVTYRWDLYRVALNDFMAHPLIGIGTGNFRNTDGLRTAHNALLTIAAENGLSGIIPFIGWLSVILIRAWRSKSDMRYGLIAFWIQQLFDDQWLDPIASVLLGFAIANTEKE